jgi:cytidylate kinase
MRTKRRIFKIALVTISMSLGSGEVGIAQQVADALKVKLYDDHELKDTALRMEIRSEDLKSLDEKAPGFCDRILSRRPELYRDFMETSEVSTDISVMPSSGD